MSAPRDPLPDLDFDDGVEAHELPSGFGMAQYRRAKRAFDLEFGWMKTQPAPLTKLPETP